MAQTLYKGADAAYPGGKLPAGTKVLAAYVGIPGQGTASPDTPHIWTKDDWNGYIDEDPQLRLLPVYVHNYYDGNPVKDAQNAVASVKELGWSDWLKGAAERFICIDTEIFVDYKYFQEMGNEVYKHGYRVVMYGSTHYVRQNPPFGGYWFAEYNYSHAPTAVPAGGVGIQWIAGNQANGNWDLSVFTQTLYEGCGHGPRR